MTHEPWKETFLNESGEMKNGTPETENIFFDELAKQIREVVVHFKKDNNGKKQRANHAKILAGFTNAIFRILPVNEFTRDLYVGFLIPGKEYKTTIRFSNAGAEIVSDDSMPDLRGVALQIETQNGVNDFLMTNAELHHAKNANEAMIAIRAGVERDVIADMIPDIVPGENEIAGLIGALPFLIKHLGLKTGFHIANTLKKQMKIKVESLSTETFWSRAAIAMGRDTTPGNSIAVKYRIRPSIEKRDQHHITAEKNLESELMKRLSERDIKFYFEVQRFKNAEETPIEDSTKKWTTEFFPIAELIIPKGSSNDKELVDQVEFSPWNIDANHFKPLGSMNRSRKKVYEASVGERKGRIA